MQTRRDFSQGLKDRINKEAEPEAALIYMVDCGKEKPNAMMVIFRGTLDQCHELFEKLDHQSSLWAKGKRRRLATLAILDLKLGEGPRY